METEVREGVTEIVPSRLRRSAVAIELPAEREAELRTLCDPAVLEFLSARHIRLVGFVEAMNLLADADRGRGTP